MLFLVLEVRAIMDGCLDRKAYPDVCDHPETETLQETALHVLRQLSAFLQLRVGTDDPLPAETPAEDFPSWRRRFDHTVEALAAAGIRTCSDRTEGWERYQSSRFGWSWQLGAFAAFAGYDWDEITGDRDPQDAADKVDAEGR